MRGSSLPDGPVYRFPGCHDSPPLFRRVSLERPSLAVNRPLVRFPPLAPTWAQESVPRMPLRLAICAPQPTLGPDTWTESVSARTRCWPAPYRH